MGQCLSSSKGYVAPELASVSNRQIASDVMMDFIIATEPPVDREVSINEDNTIVTLTGYFVPVQVLKVLHEYEEYVDLQHFNYQEATSE
ncbi:hypothetical protein Tco_1444343 [Tanacetum coccineum]